MIERPPKSRGAVGVQEHPPIPGERLNELLNLCHSLEQEKDSKKFQELLPLFLNHLENLAHTPLSSNIEKTYRKMQSEGLLVRVENLSRVISSIKDHSSYIVGDSEDHYANAVIPENEGIRLAFAEAQAPGPVRLLMGYDVRSAVAFKPDSVNVYEIETPEGDTRDVGFRKQVCRHVHGSIEPDYIKHIVLRIPRKIFPEGRLTDQEKTMTSMYIFRSLEL